jgi:transposase
MEDRRMIRIPPTDDARPSLARTMKTSDERRLRGRCQALLMAARGRPHVQIAEDLGVHVRTVQRWLNACQAQGLAGLRIRWAPGRAPRIPEGWAAEILGWMTKGPAGSGLDRANWTYAELAAHLYRTHGSAVSASTMHSFCTRHGVRPYRPTYRYLKGDPAKQEAARRELNAFKKSPDGRTGPAESR